jgi:hypothetical protein
MSEPAAPTPVETDPDAFRAAAHTPDSFTRSLLGEVLDAMATPEGASMDGPFQLTVTVRRLDRAADVAEAAGDGTTDAPLGGLVTPTSPGAIVCIHVPFSETQVCSFWPPIVTY